MLFTLQGVYTLVSILPTLTYANATYGVMANEYRIYSRISQPAHKPTPIPAAENVAKISDSHISR